MTARRWAAYSAGGALMIFGAAGLLSDPADTHPLAWALWFGGGVIAHDLVIAPLVLAAGWALRPLARPVRAALLVSVLVTAGALPVVLALGRKPDNPSILPLPYGRNLILVLAAVWLLTAAVAAWTHHHHRHHRHHRHHHRHHPTRPNPGR